MNPRLFDRPAHELPPLRIRVISAVLLAVFCLATYDACNYVASLRDPSRCLAADWEFHLPRLTWTVVPYWSIDILIVVAPIIARRFDEWRTLLRRMVWAFTIACLVFLIYPCRCGYERSIPDDWTSWLFQLLHHTDLPFNQAPSLHVCEAIIIGPILLARFRGMAARAIIVLWLTLGSLATMFTYQHHLVDVVSGAVLGFMVVRIIRRR